MAIIGNLIKETTKRTYVKRSGLSITHDLKVAEQVQTLVELLQEAKHTDFGKTHKFGDIPASSDAMKLFSQQVPLCNYETFHRDWLSKSLEGKANIIWPGKIQNYALSSGTTSDSSKRIPVSDSMIRQFQKTTMRQILDTHAQDFPGSFYNARILTVGGSTKLRNLGEYYEGDLSGILARHKSFALTPFTKPRRRISNLKDWNEKMSAMVERAPKWNIGVIAGVPAWITMLLEEIIRHYQLKNIHELWPNLGLYLHGGVFFEPYKERFKRCLGKDVVYQNTYLASEGYFAYQRDTTTEGMEVLSGSGIYFEFIEEKYFDKVRSGELVNLPVLTLADIEEGQPYGLVISTCSGLWRYIIGDVIEFTDKNQCKLNILGRISSSLSSLGEHLSEGNMIAGIHKTSDELGVTIEEFCVYTAKSKDQHKWFLGSNQRIEDGRFAKILDTHLKSLNDDYATIRKHLLKEPLVRSLPVEKFYEFLEAKNKLGAQHKFPRVMNETRSEEWELFLANSKSISNH